VTILFDHRETRSGVPAALEAAGIAVAPEQLPAGDYIVSDRLVVERKTGADLAASIKNRRLFEQVERLSAAFSAVVLVVEGEPIHMPREAGRARSAAHARRASRCCRPTIRPTPRHGSRACSVSRLERRTRPRRRRTAGIERGRSATALASTLQGRSLRAALRR
jgi:hypothetical protein